jgi:hypothetical protein
VLAETYLTPAEFVKRAKEVIPCATMKCRVCGDRWPFVWACSLCGLCPDDCPCGGRDK